MFEGWGRKTLLNTRVKALLQDTKWYLEASQPEHIAKILVMSQLMRREVFGLDDEILELLDNPFEAPHADVVSLYRNLELARNNTKRQHKQLHRQVHMPGVFDKEHTTAGERAFDVWLATLGSAIAQNGLPYGQQIWKILSHGIEKYVPAVIADLRTREATTGESIIGDVGFMEMDMLFRYIPSAFGNSGNA